MKEEALTLVEHLVIAILFVIIGSFCTEILIKNKYYWTDEPYEPTIQITTESGVQDTTYGYKIYEIIDK